MYSSDEAARDGSQDEGGDRGGRIGKLLLVTFPFIFLLAFLLLEVWIRGRF